MRRSKDISPYTLNMNQVKELIDSAADSGVRSLSLTGGEPLLYLDDIVALTKHASRADYRAFAMNCTGEAGTDQFIATPSCHLVPYGKVNQALAEAA